MKYLTFLLLITFSGLLAPPEARVSGKAKQGNTLRHSLQLRQKMLQKGDSLIVMVNGYFEANGDCGSSLSWGWLKRNDQGKWDTLVNARHRQYMECGFTRRKFHKEDM